MQESQEQRQARAFYESLEYEVNTIDVAVADGGRRADYLVTGLDTIVTEVKSRVRGAAYEGCARKPRP